MYFSRETAFLTTNLNAGKLASSIKKGTNPVLIEIQVDKLNNSPPLNSPQI